MKSLVKYLDCGRYESVLGHDHGNYVVTRFTDICNIIIPFFEKYPLQGIKVEDFNDFRKVAEIMNVNGHLTQSGLKEIRLIKAGTNRGRLS
jgi:hypothetical protein